MPSIYRILYETYRQYYDKYADHRSDDWFLMGSPWPVIAIAMLYVYFVNNLGPRLMKDRPAFNVDKLVSLYNLLQICFCAHIVYRANALGWGTKYAIFCEPIDYSDTPFAVQVARTVWMFHLIKFVDLFDTVFFILRKKNSQATFLHVYHHTLMFLSTWLVTKFLPGGHGTFLGYLNCIVHVVMYAYYFATSMWPQYKKSIWWKKHITQLQMLQFVLVGLHGLSVLVIRDCQYPRLMSVVIGTQCLTMFVLFFDFYRKAYSSIREKY